MITKSSLTVLFEPPFWIGVYERIEDDRYEACKIIFCAEPKDYEVYDFLLQNFTELRFSPSVKMDKVKEHRINPKRMQREISSQLQDSGIGTNAQQALKLQHEQGKIERKVKNREQRDAEKERQYALRQDRKKAKHRGHSIK